MSEVAENPAPEAQTQVTPYDLIGGEAGLRRLVDRFYEIMDADPRAATIRAMHAADLGPVSQSLFEFMSGWLGGPPLYARRTGSICITGAHRPFAIGPEERDQWLMCMRQALVDVGVDEKVRKMFDAPLASIADFVRNR